MKRLERKIALRCAVNGSWNEVSLEFSCSLGGRDGREEVHVSACVYVSGADFRKNMGPNTSAAAVPKM